MFMMNLFKQIFIWWNRQTIGTLIYTFFTGKLVGNDEFNNKYYTNKYGKRWVIYHNVVEASKIPPEWHSWIHFIKKDIPNKNIEKYSWQKKYVENLTGTNMAHKPEGSLKLKSKKSMKKYEVWRD
jgi:NADH:ubiquinone oxidoreductase subunit